MSEKENNEHNKSNWPEAAQSIFFNLAQLILFVAIILGVVYCFHDGSVGNRCRQCIEAKRDNCTEICSVKFSDSF